MIISNMPHVLSGKAFGCAHIIAPEASEKRFGNLVEITAIIPRIL